MPDNIFIVVIVTLVLAAAFLAIWMRRDRQSRGTASPEPLHGPLGGVEHRGGRHA